MKVLVTGAGGFIGKSLARALAERGDEVVAVQRSAPEGLPAGVRIVRADVTDMESLKDAGAGCEMVYHLAAEITFDPRRGDELMKANAAGVENILKAAARWGARRAVVASSACTMGLSRRADAPLDERSQPDEGLSRNNPYMASKLAAERAAFSAAGVEVVVVNPVTVYGPGDDTLNSGTLIKKVAETGIMPAPAGGSTVVDVDDAARGFIAAGERGRPGERYIIGAERLPFIEIIETIASVTGRRPKIIAMPGAARIPLSTAAWAAGRVTGNRFLTAQVVGDMFLYKYYSSEKARRELGWTPEYAFRQSVERAWEYYKKRGLM